MRVFPLIFAFPQINFHLADNFNNQHEHSCLLISVPELLDSKDHEEILSFCLTESLVKSNPADPKFTFDDLRKQNITSEQLYQWSAPIKSMKNNVGNLK